ncbi:hypothetical protein RUM43_011579 [Polyplax serrata]|uniref:Uncharacterized protein n=1 Tax=Polyplax serrata TaxID=468196 RepID=A0AAN8RTN9_POLSC
MYVDVTLQDIDSKKPCDCSKCNGKTDNINTLVPPILGHKLQGSSKSSCSLCEQRKEMIRMEREKQRQRQKCPFEILGAVSLKGKSSDEIFDEFRELVVPSQNGFFDMMRGIVKTMHVSSESELKWAKEKEAKSKIETKKMERMEKLEKIKKQVTSTSKNLENSTAS